MSAKRMRYEVIKRGSYAHINQWYETDEDQVRRQKQQEERDNKLAQIAVEKAIFLESAAAIPLFPNLYAAWLVDHVRANGQVRRETTNYPYQDPWADKYDYGQPTYWLLTNPETVPRDMPACREGAPLHVFIAPWMQKFERQFLDAHNVADPTSPIIDRYSTRPDFAAGPGFAYGNNSVRLFGDGSTAPYTNNQSIPINLYRDIQPLVQDITGLDTSMMHLLDRLDIRGGNAQLSL